MRAWLITWEHLSESAEVADAIAALLSSRWSERRVVDVMEQLYALRGSNLSELAAYAKSPKTNPYRVHTVDNHGDILTCGSHPWLLGRKVSDFKVKIDTAGYETASWREPNRYRLKADGTGLEISHSGHEDSVTRIVLGPLSGEAVWDTAAGRRKPAFGSRAG